MRAVEPGLPDQDEPQLQLFSCPVCGSDLYFRNTQCRCGTRVAYSPVTQRMEADVAFCHNRADISCNWAAEKDGYCRSCAMTRTVPDLREAGNLPLWSATELAKRWMLANLGRWGWFDSDDAGQRPVFRMLSEHTSAGDAQVIMGHADGVITINVSEASDATRAERQAAMGELYRTMLGHMRHEMAHFLFIRLRERPGFIERFRDLFGDERDDYSAALKRHYANPRDPGDAFVTHYATAHPHEDWAETIAHLLHLVDLLDSACASRLSLPDGPGAGYDAYAEDRTEAVIGDAIAMSVAVNHVNRAMDLPDLYPFVLTSKVREKLTFAHAHLHEANPAIAQQDSPSQ